MLNLAEATKNFYNLPRYAKRFFVIIIDVGICILATWFAFYLRLEEFVNINNITTLAVLISIILVIPIFWLSGLYNTMFRFAGSSIIMTVALATFTYSLLYFSIIGIFVIPGIPRSIGIIQPVLLFSGISISRLTIKLLFLNNLKKVKNKKKVLIYGAGSSGRQLLSTLDNNYEMEVVGFLDDNIHYHKQKILGQTVFNPSDIEKLIKTKDIDIILMAITTISRQRRNQIIDSLLKYKIKVKTLPSIQDIIEDRITVSDIKDLTIEDMLGREQIKPNPKLLSKNVTLKTVMVTGAGGSIGSELSRQILRLNPKKIILVELNEYALYLINEELKSLNKNNIQIIPLLVNVQNQSKIEQILKIFRVNSLFHAAAYKHVPLVEQNICESIKNNVFGTFSVAKAALNCNISNFVLISSDKAVRPTNIMGATKRLAEICVQSLFLYKNINSKFSVVRFGNVLESSGSVIPMFKKQIKEGGPITLTHPDVTRYFMSVAEAAELVIQAGAMGDKCEVFVLNMGESVKINHLINKMIKLSGLTIKDSNNLDGDIEVKIIGLRPGEKLYEELLIGDNPEKTYHDKIYKAQDPHIEYNELKIDLDYLYKLLDENKILDVKKLISKLVNSYNPNSEIVDCFYKEQQNLTSDLRLQKENYDYKNRVINIKKNN